MNIIVKNVVIRYFW